MTDFLRIEARQSMFILDGSAAAPLPSGSGGPVLAGPEAIFVAGRIEYDAPTTVRLGVLGNEGDLVLAYRGRLSTPNYQLRVVTVDQEVLGCVAVPGTVTAIAVFLSDLDEPDEIFVGISGLS